MSVPTTRTHIRHERAPGQHEATWFPTPTKRDRRRVRAVIGVVILLLLPLAKLVAGYLELASAISRQAATGVLLLVLGVGAGCGC